MKLSEISLTEHINSAFELSVEKPILIFKHSPYCSVSHYAHNQFSTFLENAPENFEYFLVDVINSKPLSRQIAEKTGIEHQSPQALVIYKEKCVWNDSHGSLTTEAFKEITHQAF